MTPSKKNFVALPFACLALLAASSVFAIDPGDDLLIAGAARTNRWIADLYINNPGATTVSVDVMWLERGQANPDPVTASFSVSAGETLILDDVLSNTFGMNRAEGAFRISATGGVVTANLIVFTGAGSPDGTYGSGFEAIPASAATSTGEFTCLMGLASDSSFYTNLFALAGANGVTMDVDLLDPDGDLLDSAHVVLEAYEPWLATVADLWDVASFANGTAVARVSEGSMVMLGSKIDAVSKDPTTLEQDFRGGLSEEDMASIRAVFEENEQAGLAGDWETFLSHFAEDAVIMWPNRPDIVGLQAIRGVNWIRAREYDHSIDEIVGTCDLAYVRGTYSLWLDVPSAVREEGKFLYIMRKQSDGSWLFAVWMTNLDQP
jgi:ketosteroid isomerase-like protein